MTQRCSLAAMALALLGLAGCAPRRNAEQLEREATQLFRGGQLKEAQALLERETDKSLEKAGPEWRSRLRCLQGEVLIARAEPAAAERVLSEPMPEARWEERRRMLLGGVRLRQRRPQEAEALLKGVERGPGDEPTRLQAMVYLSALYQEGRRPEARQRLAEVSLRAKALGEDYLEGMAGTNLSVVELRDQRYDEGIRVAKEAYTLAERRRYLSMAGRLATTIADGYTHLGDFRRSEEWQSQVGRLAEATGDLSIMLGHHAGLGNLYYYVGRYREAAGEFRQAIALAIRAGYPTTTWVSNLALALIESGQYDEAEKWNREAAKQRQGTNDVSERFFTLLNEGSIALGRERLDDAERAYRAVLAEKAGKLTQEWDAEMGLARVERRRGRAEEARLHYARALRLVEIKLNGVSDVEMEMVFQGHLMQLYREVVAELMERSRVEEALEVAESSRARWLALQSGRGGGVVTAARAVAEAKALTADGSTAVLFYWVAPERSFGWTISRGRVTVKSLPGAEEIGKLVSAARREIERGTKAEPGGPESAGARLYQAVVEPLMAGVERGRRVVVVADGALHRVNLECLPVEQGGRHFWLEDVVEVLSPSLAMMVQRWKGGRGEERALLVGATEGAGEYRALTHAREEVEGIERVLGSDRVKKLLGAEATVPGFERAKPQEYEVLHFAAHGDSVRQSPLDSSIILTPEQGEFRLKLRRVLELPALRARLVTVSSCRSAGETEFAGEGLVGFAWAFLEAGARVVVAGLWDVSDGPGTEIMKKFYEGRRAGQSEEGALRAAKLWMAKEKRLAAYHWGPLQIYARSLPGSK